MKTDDNTGHTFQPETYLTKKLILQKAISENRLPSVLSRPHQQEL